MLNVLTYLKGNFHIYSQTVSGVIVYFQVGLLDVDLCGPSLPKMFGVNGQDVHQCPEG